MAKKPLLPEEEDDNRKRRNPFEDDDERDGVDLGEPPSPKNSYLDPEDEDEEIDVDLFDDDSE